MLLFQRQKRKWKFKLRRIIAKHRHSKSNKKWIGDSGATSHCTKSKKLFSKFKPMGKTITMADGHEVKSKELEIARLNWSTNKEKQRSIVNYGIFRCHLIWRNKIISSLDFKQFSYVFHSLHNYFQQYSKFSKSLFRWKISKYLQNKIQRKCRYSWFERPPKDAFASN